jgi:hypothetical protein
MNFDGKQMQEEFNDAFKDSALTVENLNPKQLWWLVKFAKHVRLRCRNNSAFNNYMNRNFPNASFREVTKTNREGRNYQGLSISVNGLEYQPEDSE